VPGVPETNAEIVRIDRSVASFYPRGHDFAGLGPNHRAKPHYVAGAKNAAFRAKRHGDGGQVVLRRAENFPSRAGTRIFEFVAPDEHQWLQKPGRTLLLLPDEIAKFPSSTMAMSFAGVPEQFSAWIFTRSSELVRGYVQRGLVTSGGFGTINLQESPGRRRR